MNETLRKVFDHVANWPLEDQEELVGHAKEIEARRAGNYTNCL